jgi:hypothetical protein
VSADKTFMDRLAHGLQRRLPLLLAASFAAAALAPAAGLWMRGAAVAGMPLPSLLLALLLLNAGLGVEAARLRPAALGLAILAHLAVPVLFIVGFAWACGGATGAALARLAGPWTVVFVAAPPTGIALRRMVGEAGLLRARPTLQVAALAVLLALCYATGAAVLPGMVARPEWGRIGAVAAACAALCGAAFGVGAAVSAFSDADARAALKLGLGRMHGSTGLALAGLALAPVALSPFALIAYVVAQQVVAGLLGRRDPASRRAPRRAPSMATWRPRRRAETVLCAR